MDSLIDRYVDANTADIRKRLLPAALKVLHRHRRRGDRVLVATGAPPELARAILDFVAHEGLPVIGSLGKPFLGGFITDQHCHAANKMRMIHRSEEHTSELQSLMRISYAVFRLKNKTS